MMLPELEDNMATLPTPLRAAAHHGYKSWSCSWYDDEGHRHSRRFGRVKEVRKRVALKVYEAWRAREWKGRLHIPNPHDPNTLTVQRLCVTYHKHAESIYKKGGKATTQMSQVASALNALMEAHGAKAAEDIGSPELTRLRDAMIHSGKRKNRPVTLTVGTVNGRIKVIKQAYAWARSYGMVSREAAYDVSLTQLLRAGRCEARPPKPILPVPDDILAETLAHCPPTVADMVKVLIITGMRAGELCQMKPIHIEVVNGDRPLWRYRPPSHKTEHHGRTRVISMGMPAIKILQPYIDKRKASDFVFTPMDAHRERLEMNGRPKVQAYQMSRSVFKPSRAYDKDTFRNAVQRGCDRAYDPLGERRAKHDWSYRWHPHQLRHNAATWMRQEHGIEAASDMLGHKTLSTTAIYAERTQRRQDEIARKAAG